MKKVVLLDYDKHLLPKIGDSMCFDSGFTALSAEVFDGSDKYEVYIRATGHVKVFYNDNVYKNASSMPEELLELFRTEGINAALGHDVDIVENNWWETFIYKNGEYMDSCLFEGCPSDFQNEEEIEQYILDTLEYYF